MTIQYRIIHSAQPGGGGIAHILETHGEHYGLTLQSFRDLNPKKDPTQRGGRDVLIIGDVLTITPPQTARDEVEYESIDQRVERICPHCYMERV